MIEEVLAKMNLTESPIKRRDGIEENVLACIGSTPLVRVNNIIKSEGLKEWISKTLLKFLKQCF